MADKSKSNNPNSKANLSGNPGSQARRAGAEDDVVSEATIDRLESLTGGAEDPERPVGELRRQTDALDASTEEEIDALRVNLLQDDNEIDSRDGSGRIVDDMAAEKLSGYTEVGPDLADKGVVSVVPGRDNTSRTLRKEHPDTTVGRAQDILEGNLDEPRAEIISDRKVDEGTAA